MAESGRAMHGQGAGRGTRRRLIGLALAALLAAPALAARQAGAADPASPVGTWRTIDDASGKPVALIRIFARSGLLYGVVAKGLLAHPAHTACDSCTDDRRGKPIIGMEIIRGLARDGDHWGGGTILDPDTGKIYRCRLALRDGGRRLAVRGFIGISLLGRTQLWERID